MRHEDKQKYLDLGNRVFVRALRDPNGNEEFELSEGEATDLLWRRELAACEPFVAAMRDLMPILEAVRFSVGFGKNQNERINRAKTLLAEQDARLKSADGIKARVTLNRNGESKNG